MFKLPLVQAVNSHIEKNTISFHVPGHKNGLIYEGSNEFKKFLENDLTELTNLDDLHNPEDAIEKAERKLSDLYKSKYSYFLVGGSTVGNLSMILATLKNGNKILVQRNSHKSIFNALKLVKACPIFISPEMDDDLDVAKGLSYESVNQAITHNLDAKVLILTYPNYYGHTYDIKKIIDLAHSKGIVVLVDEAHGAHFQLGSPFPTSALSFGADVVVQSAHKTLPAMTMGSWIHLNSDRVSAKKIREFLGMLQSSSPSYPIMMSLDVARNYLENFSINDIDYTIQEINNFKDNLAKITGLKVIQTNDPLKLIIQSGKGISGKKLQLNLEENGIFTELSDHKNVLLVLPLLKKDIKYPYDKAILAIKESVNTNQITDNKLKDSVVYERNKFSKLELSYTKMEEIEEECISLNIAVNRVSAETIIPYPPGIPLIIKGEKITKEMISNLKLCLKMGIRLQGCSKLSSNELVVFCK